MRSALAALLALSSAPLPVSERAERPPAALARGVAARLATTSLRVAPEPVTLWLVRPLPASASAFAAGALVGAIRVEGAWRDYRDREVPAGVYTLRYARQPPLKEHAGVAPTRDFLLLVPASLDGGGDAGVEVWIAASRGVSAGTPPHPAVLALLPAAAGSRPLASEEGGTRLLAPAGAGFALVVRGHGVLDAF